MCCRLHDLRPAKTCRHWQIKSVGEAPHSVLSASGDLPTESAALSNDPQNDYGPSERLGSLTPSVSHSASPSSLEVHHPCKVSPVLPASSCSSSSSHPARAAMHAWHGTNHSWSVIQWTGTSLSLPPDEASGLQPAKQPSYYCNHFVWANKMLACMSSLFLALSQCRHGQSYLSSVC